MILNILEQIAVYDYNYKRMIIIIRLYLYKGYEFEHHNNSHELYTSLDNVISYFCHRKDLYFYCNFQVIMLMGNIF